MRSQTQRIMGNTSCALPFDAQSFKITNPTGTWVYVRIGGQDAPSPTNYDFVCPPACIITEPIMPCGLFGLSLGTKYYPTATTEGAQPSVTFYDTPQPPSVTAIELDVSFQKKWTWLNKYFGATEVYNWLTPPTGKALQIFKIRQNADTTTTSGGFAYWHTTQTPPDFLEIEYSQQNRSDTVELPGIILPINAVLHVENYSGGARNPSIGALYQII
jgi:hypothetical protein